MSKRTSYARNIFFSIVVSLVILLALGFLSVKYLVPIYDLQSQDIYKFLIYLLPVIIGLALIEIGSIISTKNSIDNEDNEDLLPKNSYDSPLFNTINDDPLEKRGFSNYSNYNTLDNLNLPFDSEVLQKLKNYKNCEIINILKDYELGKNNNQLSSPFDEETTEKLFSLSKDNVLKAISWIDQGSPVVNEKAIVLSNLTDQTVAEISKLSQREAEFALDWVKKGPKYINLENLNESNKYAVSQLNNDDVSKALAWINLGCPEARDPKAVVYDNLDKDTLERLKEYNSIQVNVGLDYIDEGAPDVEDPKAVILPNISEATIDRLLKFSDFEINKGLNSLDNEFIDNLDQTTMKRLNSYTPDQINSGLDFVDNGQPSIEEPLPFDEITNLAIRNFSIDEARDAINYISNSKELNLGDLSNNLEDFLNSELKDNLNENFNFDITLVLFDKDKILEQSIKNSLFSQLPSYTYLFKTSNGIDAIIFPYEGKVKAKDYIDNLFKSDISDIPQCNVKISYAAQEKRNIQAKDLILEAMQS
ncbi:MAG: hypothetical protein EOL97_01055 [Spirochaetia bacterium]|nr:hypothetical protein [Spirochaetia bacterium]